MNAFQKIIDDLKLKPNNIWVDKGSEFYNRPIKSYLEKNDIEIHSIHNEGKSTVVKRLIRTLKSKIYKYMTWVSKNVYTDKLDDIVDEYNNTYHRTIKMKPVDVMSGNYNEYIVNSNDKNPKFQVGDKIRISKDKNISSWHTTFWGRRSPEGRNVQDLQRTFRRPSWDQYKNWWFNEEVVS